MSNTDPPFPDPFTEEASESTCESIAPTVCPAVNQPADSDTKKKKKRYIYNKTGQLSRFRSCAMKHSFLCQNCGADIKYTDTCSYCGQPVPAFVAGRGKQRNLKRDFYLFLDYYQGTSRVPFFVLNYLNHYVLEIK